MKIVPFVLSLSLSSLASAALPKDVDHVMQQIMSQHYGQSWDKKNKCRRYQSQGVEYCVTLSGTQAVQEGDGQTWYMTTSGEAYNSDGEIGQSGHAESGIGGFFVLKKTQLGWSKVSALPEFESGQWGQSQMAEVKLTEIGVQRYGWVGKFSGSGAGGETNASWVIYAPVGKQVLEIANIDADHSYDGSESSEVTETQFKFLQQQPVYGYYKVQANFVQTITPLNPRTMEPMSRKAKHTKRQFILSFDPKKNNYH